MKWSRPYNNQRRIRKGFLWFPKGDRQMRWLEYAKWNEIYYKNPLFFIDGFWLFDTWIF